MEAKTFSVKRDDKPGIHVTGFPPNGGWGFINLKFGDDHGGQFNVILYMDDARALSVALADAIKHADPVSSEEAA